MARPRGAVLTARWVTVAVGLAALLLTTGLSRPAVAAPASESATDCELGQTSITVPFGEFVDVSFSWSGGTPSGGRVYLWYSATLDGVDLGGSRWEESGTPGTYDFRYSYIPSWAGQTLVESWSAIADGRTGPDGPVMCSITVIYGPMVYSVTVDAAADGSASASPAAVTSGGSSTLTATADSGYSFDSWSCTGGGTLSSSTANPATLSDITADATCTPSFVVEVRGEDAVGDTGGERGPNALSCSPDPVVAGGVVTCLVTGGDPNVEMLWRASYNPVFASQGVMLDASGNGSFSFVAPAAALGLPVTVELVEWDRTAVVMVGGPVPVSVPAGEGPGVPAGLLLAGLVAAAFGLRRLAVGTAG